MVSLVRCYKVCSTNENGAFETGLNCPQCGCGTNGVENLNDVPAANNRIFCSSRTLHVKFEIKFYGKTIYLENIEIVKRRLCGRNKFQNKFAVRTDECTPMNVLSRIVHGSIQSR